MRHLPSDLRSEAPVRYWPDAGLLASFFDDFPFRLSSDRGIVPAVDILEKDGNLILRAEVPGMSEKDIAIKLDGSVLTLSGEKKIENEDKRDNYHRVERSFGSFTRSFTLPETADREKISADYKNGVLTITVPMRAEAKPRQVPISVQ